MIPLLPNVTLEFGKLPHFRVSSQFFLEVQMLARIYEVQIHYERTYFDIDINIHSFRYILLSIFYHLLSHIYHLVLLVTIFEYFLYFILFVVSLLKF